VLLCCSSCMSYLACMPAGRVFLQQYHIVSCLLQPTCTAVWLLQVFWFALPRPAPPDAQLVLELYSSRDNRWGSLPDCAGASKALQTTRCRIPLCRCPLRLTM
jgi:hypothetical protein